MRLNEYVGFESVDFKQRRKKPAQESPVVYRAPIIDSPISTQPTTQPTMQTTTVAVSNQSQPERQSDLVVE